MFFSQKIILLGLFIASVFSCSPNNFDENYIAIALAGTNDWRVNVAGAGTITVGGEIITYNSGNQPDRNEIFMIIQQTPGIFEFLSYLSFYRNYAIGIQSANSGDTFRLQQRTDTGIQQFTFNCETCNVQTDVQNWVPYHTSCKIKNVGSGFCMIGYPSVTEVNQTDCATASKWDLFGRISPDITNSTTSTTSPNSSITQSPSPSSSPNSTNNSTSSTSDIHLSPGGLIGIILGSCAITTFIALLIRYWSSHRQKFIANSDRVDVQIQGSG